MTCGYVPVRQFVEEEIDRLQKGEYALALITPANTLNIVLKALEKNNIKLVSQADPLAHRIQI
jgi:hypothetical protein